MRVVPLSSDRAPRKDPAGPASSTHMLWRAYNDRTGRAVVHRHREFIYIGEIFEKQHAALHQSGMAVPSIVLHQVWTIAHSAFPGIDCNVVGTHATDFQATFVDDLSQSIDRGSAYARVVEVVEIGRRSTLEFRDFSKGRAD